MGFTIEDMLILSKTRYKMEMIAGENGWSNSISWVHLLEDTTIIQHFWGKELAVTTGLGFKTTGAWKALLEDLLRHHAAGLIINVGKYIMEVPQEIIEYCNTNDFPLMIVPWEIFLSDMIKDFSIRIFLQGNADEQISNALISAVEQPDNQESYRKELLPYFDVDGTFQVVLISTGDLDTMDTVERKKLSYRIQVYLEKITHNGNFFYYDSNFILVVNDVSSKDLDEIVTGMCMRAQRRMPEIPLYTGVGSRVTDISNLSIGYHRAKAAVTMAQNKHEGLLYFDQMGLYRLLYAVEDQPLLQEIVESQLAPLIHYDKKHNGNYLETLEMYLKYNGSIQAVSNAMYTHRNTVIYRMTNIKKLLGCELATPEERLPYQMAFYIYRM
ncbi:PucR family transcriptional regulator [Lachnospiraceae bacterium SGI.085]